MEAIGKKCTIFVLKLRKIAQTKIYNPKQCSYARSGAGVAKQFELYKTT